MHLCVFGFKLTAALLMALLFTGAVLAEKQPVLTAEESDPQVMGWMQGFPPPPDKLITQPDANYFSFPKLRWSVCHLREFLPTEQVSRGLGAPVPLDYALDEAAIDALTFKALDGDEEWTFEQSLSLNYTDGLLIIHNGKVVYERYLGCLDEKGQHAAMSMTKSLTGLLAEILVAEGTLDASKMVAEIVPELSESAFGNATVRQVMDMVTGLSYSENYADPDADIWAYSAAASPMPRSHDDKGPFGYFEYLQTVQPEGHHGEAFHYKTINTDALGWILSRVSGKEVTELLSERIWSRMGAEQDAYMAVDGKGVPFAGGGLSAGLRDLGRIGLLMLNEGQLNGQQVFPPAAVTSIRQGGDKAAFAKAGYKALAGGSYRGMWWLLHNKNGAFAARGVHGQTIYIDPTANMVLVRLASFPVAVNSAIDPTSLPAYQAVADYLMSKSTEIQAGEWFIEDIAGAGVIDKSPASLLFLANGRLTGNASCNRMMGQYTEHESSLSITLGGVTRMACPEALMIQEQRLLDILATVEHYEITADGALILSTAGKETITARLR